MFKRFDELPDRSTFSHTGRLWRKVKGVGDANAFEIGTNSKVRLPDYLIVKQLENQDVQNLLDCRTLLAEWLHNGRFLVAGCDEYEDLLTRTKKLLGED